MESLENNNDRKQMRSCHQKGWVENLEEVSREEDEGQELKYSIERIENRLNEVPPDINEIENIMKKLKNTNATGEKMVAADIGKTYGNKTESGLCIILEEV
ncbi:hypothetical protein HHI36_017277 [Cryptolaemus montrouzieri]|uniref:Uncharacterized protein n=1 Tax=Cryptolaemus montrouzieri TaxID=559131 RepID=A0ABD2NML1_9CUCU